MTERFQRLKLDLIPPDSYTLIIRQEGRITNTTLRVAPEAKGRMEANLRALSSLTGKPVRIEFLPWYGKGADKQLDVDNGLTLCKTCHDKVPRRRRGYIG